jgi:hypothetical protein
MNNAARLLYGENDYCSLEPSRTAAFLLDPQARATLDHTAAHYVRLSAALKKGRPPHLIAGAPCTHAPEGIGYGAVNAHAGALWYVCQSDYTGLTTQA